MSKELTSRFIDVYSYLIKEKIINGKTDFAEKLTVSASSLTEIWKGRSNVGIKLIQNTVKLFDFLDTEWLLTGKGRMLKEDSNSTERPHPKATKCSNCEALADKLKDKERIIAALEFSIAVLESSLTTKEDLIAILKKQAAGNATEEKAA